jgi:hypothetical protein
MNHSYAEAGARLFDGMLARTHLSQPAHVGDVVAEELEKALGATDVVVYLVNLEQTALVPIPRRDFATAASQDLDSTVAGRSFAGTKILSTAGSEPSRLRVYVPLIDGTDRLGTLQAELQAADGDELPDDLMVILERFGHAVAQMLLAKRMYGDSLHLVQRSRPLEVGAELLSAVLPPSTFATDGLVISAIVQPAYENGGDAYDYAVNDDAVHLAVFDAVGHGLHAACFRRSRLLPTERADARVTTSSRCTRPWIWPSANSSVATSSPPASSPSWIPIPASSGGSTPAIPRRCCCAATGSSSRCRARGLRPWGCRCSRPSRRSRRSGSNPAT